MVVQRMWHRLRKLNDPQLAFHLLRFCASVSRLVYVFRCTPPHLTSAVASVHDAGMRRVFEDTHTTLTDDAWCTAWLPLRKGGLGLTPAKWITRVAYISSILPSYPFTHALFPQYQVEPIILTPLSEVHATLLPPDSSE